MSPKIMISPMTALVGWQGQARVARFTSSGHVVIERRIGSAEPDFLLSGYRLVRAGETGELAGAAVFA